MMNARPNVSAPAHPQHSTSDSLLVAYDEDALDQYQNAVRSFIMERIAKRSPYSPTESSV